MSRLSLTWSAILVLVGTVTATMLTAPLSADPPPAQGVRLTPIGNPTWEPVDFHVFSAPMGTAETGYAEFVMTALAILPPPKHAFHPDLLVGPGDPHSPPYDSELAHGVADLRFHEGVRFNTSEFSDGQGVFLVWMNVPAPGTTGSSPDFTSGPIIPNILFPMHLSGVLMRNGKVFDPNFAGDVPPLDGSLDPPFDVDGPSHFPIFIADNADFGPPGGKGRGSYEYQFELIDQSGNGWRVVAHFAVAP